MPLLISPSAPLPTPCGLPVSQLYAIVNRVSFDRLSRTGSFEVGYYVNEAASLPGSGVHQLPVNLPTGFSFSIEPGQASRSDAQAICEAYARHELTQLLPEGTTFQEVA